MSLDDVLSDLRGMYGIYLVQAVDPPTPTARLTESDVTRWNKLTGGTRQSLYGELALYLARGFHSSELTFRFCDAVANDLFGIMLSGAERDWSDLFDEVYCAFDEGEYDHRERPDEDPIEVYTRPMIAQIVAKSSN